MNPNGVKKSTWLPLAVVFGSVYFFSMNGLGGLPGLAINFLLKEHVGLTPTQLAYFLAVTTVAWVIKPLWGVISDLFPIFGSRRKSYLIVTSIFAAGGWFAIASLPNLAVALPLLLLLTLVYMAYAFQDVVTDGLMVETGQPLNMTGQFQSIQWAAVYAAMIIAALVGGHVAELARAGELSYRTIFGITALFPVVTGIIIFFLVREPSRVHHEKDAKVGLKDIFRHKGIWVLSLFLFLWTFSPSFGAPFFFYMVDTLGFSGSFLGALQAVMAGGAFLGSVLYGVVFAKWPIRKFLVFAVLIGVVAALSYFIYFVPWIVERPVLLRTIAFVMNFLFGIVSAVIFLVLLNLAARISPQYAGGTVFALLMSFYNLGQMGSQAVGGYLFPLIGLKPLIVFSAVFSLFVLILIPYLPIRETFPDATSD